MAHRRDGTARRMTDAEDRVIAQLDFAHFCRCHPWLTREDAHSAFQSLGHTLVLSAGGGPPIAGHSGRTLR